MCFTKFCMNDVMSWHLLQYTQRPRKTPVFLCGSHFFWINVFCVLGLTPLYVLYVNKISCNTRVPVRDPPTVPKLTSYLISSSYCNYQNQFPWTTRLIHILIRAHQSNSNPLLFVSLYTDMTLLLSFLPPPPPTLLLC